MSRESFAHVEKIMSVDPIEGADKIELATVLGWHVVIGKGEFKVGDRCVYIEIDSYVDLKNKRYKFLAKRGAHIRTMKMRGVYSQGLILPLSSYGFGYRMLKEGQDVTKRMHVIGPDEYTERRNAANRITQVKGLRRFFYQHESLQWIGVLLHLYKKPVVRKSNPIPPWVIKTDEVRIQTEPGIPQKWKEYCAERHVTVVATEKIDGQSTTFTLCKKGSDFEYFVCSHSCAVDPEDPSSVFALEAKKHDAQKVLAALFDKLGAKQYVTIQGETISKTARNPYYLKDGETHIYVFNLIVDGTRYGSPEMAKIVKEYGFDAVPLISVDFKLADGADAILLQADGDSAIYPGNMREGIVFRTSDGQLSFKAVSNKYLLKHEE
jgi:hypothetical protein